MDNGNIHETDFNLFDLKENEPIVFVKHNTSMIDLLVELGLFPSKGQARKNWWGPVELPDGWFQFSFGKRKIDIAIWNPQSKLEE
ncbi:MAG: hypothetical protein KGO96_07140 [Elusimicrobia bacterium]|nr:hypothetical protein [Elusimicrobiota bacterium]